MKSKIYYAWFYLYKKVSEIQSSLIYDIETKDQSSEKKNEINDVLSKIKSIKYKIRTELLDVDLNLDPSPLNEWLKRLNKLAGPSGGSTVSSILMNKEEILEIIEAMDEEVNKYISSSIIHNPTEEYHSFLSEISRLDFSYEAKSFEDTIKIKISNIEKKLKDSEDLQRSVNIIYNDIKDKNSKFNHFIDEHNNAAEQQLYKDIYDTEIKIANDYRQYALIIFFFVGFIIFLILLFSVPHSIINILSPKDYAPFEYKVTHLIKFLALFSLTIPAWYLTKESAKHRQVAWKAKTIGTELAALPYYINQLTDTERKEIRIKMADKFFGQELYNSQKSSEINIAEQIKVTTETLKLITATINTTPKNIDAPNTPISNLRSG